jgi:hypothetical protein
MDNNLNFNTPTQIKQPNTSWAIIITAVVVALLVGMGMYFLQAQKVKTLENQLSALNQTLTLLAANSVLNTQTTQSSVVSSTTTSTIATSTTKNATTTITGLKLYTDKNTGMSFQYPSNLYVHAQSDAVREKYILSNLIITTSKETYKPEPQNYFPAKTGDIRIAVHKLLGGSGELLNRDEFIKQQFATSSKQSPYTYSWVNIGDKDYRLGQTKEANYDQYIYYYISTNRVYQILVVSNGATGNNSATDNTALRQILSTFNP